MTQRPESGTAPTVESGQTSRSFRSIDVADVLIVADLLDTLDPHERGTPFVVTNPLGYLVAEIWWDPDRNEDNPTGEWAVDFTRYGEPLRGDWL